MGASDMNKSLLGSRTAELAELVSISVSGTISIDMHEYKTLGVLIGA